MDMREVHDNTHCVLFMIESLEPSPSVIIGTLCGHITRGGCVCYYGGTSSSSSNMIFHTQPTKSTLDTPKLIKF
jgi:hypothetical protein